MGYTQLYKDGLRVLRDQGIRNSIPRARMFLREASLRTLHNLNGEDQRGVPIYEEEWDLLVVLDACRVDLLREVGTDYGFLDNIEVRDSLGSYSLSWMERNFIPKYEDQMADTVYVTGNPFSEAALDPNDFCRIEEVWKYSWDERVGTIRPRALTDTAISLARELSPNQMIVHYMQPHEPFTTAPELHGGRTATKWADPTDTSVWTRVDRGDLPLERVQDAYRQELRMVLNEVEILLENVDAETAVVSADHGEAMGELGIYGHARGVAIDALRRVPWAVTTAEDTGGHTPHDHRTDKKGEQRDRLRDLGYVE